jgi:hypothetical protein
MDKEQTIASMIEELDRKIEATNKEVESVGQKIDGLKAPNRPAPKNDLLPFMRASTKTIKTVFAEDEYTKKRKYAINSLLVTLVFLFLEQFVSSTYFGLYSTFSLITLIPGIYFVFKIFKLSSFKEEMLYDDLAFAGIANYGFDGQLLPTTNLRMKGLFRWMMISGVFGALLNLIGLFVVTPAHPGLLWICILLEILTAGLLIASYFLVRELATSYCILFFKKDNITLSGDIFTKKMARVK